jgi:hypothetical protein
MGDAVRTDADPFAEPVASGFDVLEDRLRAIRQQVGLGGEDAAAVIATRGARAAAAGRPADVVRLATSAGARRAPVWDLLLLGAAWSGLAALVVLALQAG